MQKPILNNGHKKISPPNGVPIWDIDPYNEDFLKNPYPFYRELHRLGPIVYIPKYNILACGQYEVTKQVFSDYETFSSARGVGLEDIELAESWRPRSIILEADPPEHTLNKKILMQALSRKAVKDFSDVLKRSADELVQKLVEVGEVDGVKDLAEAFPTKLFPEAIGLKAPDAEKLMNYGSMVFNSIGPNTMWRQASLKNANETVPWIYENCSRSAMTNNGMASTIFAAADKGEISQEQALLLIRSLLSAGVDTTVSGLGNTLWCLANNPYALARLNQNPTKMANPIFDETLRLTSPVQAFYRTALHETKVGDIEIEEGSKILCFLAAANVDPIKWDRPEVFDVDRNSAGHLAFGMGIHYCVGQIIARAEAQAVFEAIGRHVGKIELNGEPKIRLNNSMRAYDSLPLKLGKL